MHERGVVGRCVAELLSAGGSRPLAQVTLAIGPHMNRATTEAAWWDAVEGSPAARATLTVVSAFDVLQCLACGQTYEGAQPDPCPRCANSGLVVHGAAELAVRDWRTADEEEA